ncbi:hypothetical protein HMPREF1531_01832 [Propionibacterium sp. oral taxon 192 str. F0372]|uniref:inorganic phosphate transporter n=1 Tax=Propionibacterium sp. oral taxon 192 TaxID=671222 RepID=UPI0003541C0D|nr:inorganic phosphate transporter [Propionibacterium sp. oral taxon 192]EPH02524.1 hypothetical protein HMPREF1531_01832 [Propionibacterium sp. oral taxon 192 str. F0372]
MSSSSTTHSAGQTPSSSSYPMGFLGPDTWWHLSFGSLLIVALVIFCAWSWSHVADGSNRWLLLLTIGFGCFMAFNIGGNDVANSFGTSVGAKTLTIKQALVIAAIFEVSGAVIAGASVTDTVRSGIVDLDAIHLMPLDFAFIMMSALFGAAIWLLFATWQGLPVSTTHSIVGGIVGAAVTTGMVTHTGGVDMVQWGEIGMIAVSWVLSPILGGMASYLMYRWIRRNVLVYNETADAQLRALHQERIAHRRRHKEKFDRLTEIQQISYTGMMARDAVTVTMPDFRPDKLESDYYKELYAIEAREEEINPHHALVTWVPMLAAIGAMVITSMILFKGLSNLHLGLQSTTTLLIILMVGAAVWMSVLIAARTLKKGDLSRSTFVLFSWMQVFTASTFAFSHGSNDIANAIGPFAAVLDVLGTNAINGTAAVPAALTLMCGVALISGLWFIGRNVIKTVGSGLTEMHPASGFTAELSAAAVVMGASALGLPVSSTHILIGAVLGIGIVNRAANWRLMRPIALAWLTTLPAAAGVSAASVLVLRALFG